jgi:hypothetical protein
MNIIKYLEETSNGKFSNSGHWESESVDYQLAVILNSGILIRPAHIVDQAKDANWSHDSIKSLLESIKKAYVLDVNPKDIISFNCKRETYPANFE